MRNLALGDNIIVMPQRPPLPLLARNIELAVFREILVLPLRLDDLNDHDRLSGWIGQSLLGESSPWERASGDSGFAPPSPFAPYKDKSESAFARRQAFAEMAYFHSFIHKLLYQPKSVQRFVHKEKSAIAEIELRASYGAAPWNAYRICLTVERCVLEILADPGIAILTLEVAAGPQSGLWRADDCGEAEGKLSLAEAQSIHDCLRRIYPPFLIETTTEDGLPLAYDTKLFPMAMALRRKVRAETAEAVLPPQPPTAQELQDMVKELRENLRLPYAPWWREILGPLAELGSPFVQVADDRIPSMVFVAVPGPKLVSRDDRIRLCFADGPGREPNYAPGFMAEFENKHRYGRFSHLGAGYYVSSYSFVAIVGSSGFELAVLQEHFRRHYHRMFFIVQAQKAALLMFSNFLSAATGHGPGPIREVRKRFVAFTHGLWFSNVSNQEQARELFELMQARAGNRELYAEVKAESTTAREELTTQAEESQMENALIFNMLIAVLTIFGLPLAYFGTDAAKDICLPFGKTMGVAAIVASFTVIVSGCHAASKQKSLEILHVFYAVALLCLLAAVFFFNLGEVGL